MLQKIRDVSWHVCMTRGLMNRNETATTNGTSVKLAQNVNGKTENVIYFAQCKKCNKENSYVGKTTQEFHHRVMGHRSNNKKRSHTQLDSRKQVIAFQDRVITINIKEAQHPLK